MIRWWARSTAPTGRSVEHSTDDAWRVLTLVNDWVRHAETKAATTLAACGVLGGVLFTLVRAEFVSGPAFRISSLVCAVLLFIGGFSAGMALRPRLRTRENPSTLLYYEDIARTYRTRVDAYSNALTKLIGDPGAMATAVAGQVWANAHVARRKYTWGNVGVMGLLLALTAMSASTTFAVVDL